MTEPTVATYRPCPRCAGESTFRERHLKCVKCGLEYAINGTEMDDRWLLPPHEREAVIAFWLDAGQPVIADTCVDLIGFLAKAQNKLIVVAILKWVENV